MIGFFMSLEGKLIADVDWIKEVPFILRTVLSLLIWEGGEGGGQRRRTLPSFLMFRFSMYVVLYL